MTQITDHMAAAGKNCSALSLFNVRTPADFELAAYRSGQWKSRFYRHGELAAPDARFFPEIYLDCEIELAGPEFPDRDTELLTAEHGEDGWKLVLDRYGYLCIINRRNGLPVVKSRLPVTTYTEKRFRAGLVMANVAYLSRQRPWREEFFSYCRARVFAARTVDGALRQVGDAPLENPELPVVPLRWHIPADSPLKSFRAFNTVRMELWNSPSDAGGPQVSGDFPSAGTVFPRYDAASDTLSLFTGPEFLCSQTYWINTRITGARAGRTRLRMYMSFNNNMPNMAPVFFWSTDRIAWNKVKLLEPADEAGRFLPLLEAPADDFYLSSSIPFQEPERYELLKWAEAQPFTRVEELGKSLGGRPIHLITATDFTVPDTEKKHFMFIIGQHSPQEIIGAHSIRPLLEKLGAEPEMLKKMAFHVVPTVNVDCAALVSNGCNLDGWNTNRCWNENIQPEIACIQDWIRGRNHGFELFIDIHAWGVWRNHALLWFNREVYGKYAGTHMETSMARQERFFELLEEHCGIRRDDTVDFPFRGCGAKDWMLENHPECLVYDLEMSTCSNFDPRTGHTVPVSGDTLRMIGLGWAELFRGLL